MIAWCPWHFGKLRDGVDGWSPYTDGRPYRVISPAPHCSHDYPIRQNLDATVPCCGDPFTKYVCVQILDNNPECPSMAIGEAELPKRDKLIYTTEANTKHPEVIARTLRAYLADAAPGQRESARLLSHARDRGLSDETCLQIAQEGNIENEFSQLIEQRLRRFNAPV